MKIYWSDDAMHEVATLPELDAIVARLRASPPPVMIFLEADDGTALTFGVGQDESVMSFTTAEAASYHSVGDLAREDVLEFMCHDEMQEFLGESAIPEAQAIEVARAYFQGQRQQLAVTWEADW